MHPGGTIAVHGGAGHQHPGEQPARRAGVVRAVDAGWAVLAIGGVRGVRHPVQVAHAVLRVGREVLLVGPPARAFAEAQGLAVCPPEALITEDARRRWRVHAGATGETVGAVARDARGHVAAATSTGGVAGKRSGRVGDSALIGAGTYADDRLGAGSATGPGEAIIRVALVRAALDAVARGLHPDYVAREALAQLRARTGATAGLLLLDPTGRRGIVWTTQSMASAWRSSTSNGTIVVDPAP